LRTLWQKKISASRSDAGALSGVTIADEKLFVVSKNSFTVCALKAGTGENIWQYTANSRVDSPPSIYDGFCVFGCGDGSVYCLNAADGQLVWCFDVNPFSRYIVAENRLESPWPVSGSVLVQNGIVYFAAGRSSYLDGGIRVYGLDLYTGELLYESNLTADPVYPGKDTRNSDYTAALPDILVSDGEHINMRTVQFDLELNQYENARLKTLFSTTGLLESSWAHRQNWCLSYPRTINNHRRAAGVGSGRQSQNTPAGKLIVFDASFAYVVTNPYSWLKFSPELYPNSHDGHFHQKYSRYKKDQFPMGVKIYAQKNVIRENDVSPRSRSGYDLDKKASWVLEEQFQPRAMVLANDLLFLAGWTDSVAIEEKTGRPLDPNNPDPRSFVLKILSARNGQAIAVYTLPSEPVFDGMAVAYGKLYISLKDKSVMCMGQS
jgi:hypothetical protein